MPDDDTGVTGEPRSHAHDVKEECPLALSRWWRVGLASEAAVQQFGLRDTRTVTVRNGCRTHSEVDAKQCQT
jgi:hypothetical protein